MIKFLIMLTLKVVIYILTYRLCESSTWPGNRSYAEGSFENEVSINGSSAENVLTSTHFQGVDSTRENQDAHNEKGINSLKQDFVDIIIKIMTTSGPPMSYDHHGVYRYDVGVPIELVCMNRIPMKKYILQWTDQNGFSTAIDDGYHQLHPIVNKTKLKLTPDENDVHLKLICIFYYWPGSIKNITITLVANLGSRTQYYPDTFLKAINKKESVVNEATCNSIVYYPDDISRPSPVIVRPNERIIEEFENKFVGTVIYCYKYIDFGLEEHPPIQTYERRKSKTTLYLKPEWTTYSDDINVISQHTAFNNEANVINSSERNIAHSNIGFLCFGIIGTIIALIAVSVFIVHYLRKKKSAEPNRNEQESNANMNECEYHHYETIEERFIRLPPELSHPSTSAEQASAANPNAGTEHRLPLDEDKPKPYVHYDTPYEWRVFQRGGTRLSTRESWIEYKAKQMKGSSRRH